MKFTALLLALALVGIGAMVTASAASMPLGTDPVGAGAAQVSKCDPDGLTTPAFTTLRGKVASVSIGDIAPACQGGVLQVTLVQGDIAVASGGPVTITGPVEIVPVTGGIEAWTVDGFHAVVVGP